MNTLLRVLFIVLIIAIFGAAILQIFAPEYMGRSAAYGIAKGWQREIGFWNEPFRTLSTDAEICKFAWCCGKLFSRYWLDYRMANRREKTSFIRSSQFL